jgi:hypothetical protein
MRAVTETIKVLARFDERGLHPAAFEYGGRRYEIKRINFRHSIMAGRTRIYFYSVSDDNNFWKLGFNTETLLWWIEDAYSV